MLKTILCPKTYLNTLCEAEPPPKKRLINVVNSLQVWLSTDVMELISEAQNQEREKGDDKDE